MKTKLKVLGVSAVLGVLGASTAWGYPLPEFYSLKYNNVEMIDFPDIAWNPAGGAVQTFSGLADGTEDNWGIAQVTSILDRDTPTQEVVWSTGDNNEYLTVMFGGLDIDTIIAIDTNLDGAPDSFNIQTVAATDVSPFLALYLSNDPAAYDITGGPGARGGGTTYSPITDGVLQVLMEFASGIHDDNTTLTDVDSDTVTDIPTGDGTGYLDVVFDMMGNCSGARCEAFDGNFFPVSTDGDGVADTVRDAFLEFDFRPHPDSGLTDYGWDVNSEDPVIGLSVPEPGTLLLVGMGLLGLPWMRRRKGLS